MSSVPEVELDEKVWAWVKECDGKGVSLIEEHGSYGSHITISGMMYVAAGPTPEKAVENLRMKLARQVERLEAKIDDLSAEREIIFEALHPSAFNEELEEDVDG